MYTKRRTPIITKHDDDIYVYSTGTISISNMNINIGKTKRISSTRFLESMSPIAKNGAISCTINRNKYRLLRDTYEYTMKIPHNEIDYDPDTNIMTYINSYGRCFLFESGGIFSEEFLDA